MKAGSPWSSFLPVSFLRNTTTPRARLQPDNVSVPSKPSQPCPASSQWLERNSFLTRLFTFLVNASRVFAISAPWSLCDGRSGFFGLYPQGVGRGCKAAEAATTTHYPTTAPSCLPYRHFVAQGCAGAAKRMRPPWMAEGPLPRKASAQRMKSNAGAVAGWGCASTLHFRSPPS